MEKILEYITLSEPVNCKEVSMLTALERLDRKVNQGIRNGWQPFGGISVVLTDYQGQVTQAMVKYSVGHF